MSENSKIEWTDHTFNPWIGCTKVSPGCANCYAESEDKRRGWTPAGWGKGEPRKRTTPAYWRQALKWNAIAGDWDGIETFGGQPVENHRPRVFPSLCDWLDDEVPIEWLADFLNLIRRTPHLDWLLLTKRPGLFSRRIQAVIDHAGKTPSPHDSELIVFCDEWQVENNPPHNVWMGVSVEDQNRAEQRIRKLLETPAALRFLSCEPLLGPLNLLIVHSTPFLTFNALSPGALGPREKIDWVILGGESGPRSRLNTLARMRRIIAQCQEAGVRVFVKQLGGNLSDEDLDECARASGRSMHDRKGGDPAEWPEDLRVREMPALASVETKG